MEQEVAITFKDVELIVSGNYFKGDKETRDYPGTNSYFEVCKIFVGGVNIYDLFSWEDIDVIEELIIEKIEE